MLIYLQNHAILHIECHFTIVFQFLLELIDHYSIRTAAMCRYSDWACERGKTSGRLVQHIAGRGPWSRLGLRPFVNLLRLHDSFNVNFLGNSGIKFEVEGGEGSAGADTYIPASFLLHFSQKLRFCSIFLRFSENAAFWENPEKFWSKFGKIQQKIQQNSGKICKNSLKISKNFSNLIIFNEKFEIRERCKGVHCVDLGESFPTNIYLQNLASIQPRTTPNKFVSSSSREFEFELWNFEPLICSPERGSMPL